MNYIIGVYRIIYAHVSLIKILFNKNIQQSKLTVPKIFPQNNNNINRTLFV